MSSDEEGLPRGLVAQILIHFDMPGHHIPLGTFIETAASTKAVIDSFNSEIFSDQLKYELFVLPPSDGSFKTRLGIFVVGFGALFAFIESDVGKAFITGLTTHEPAHFAEQVGRQVRARILATEDGDRTSGVEDVAKLRCQFAAAIVAEATASFLQANDVEIARAGLSIAQNRGAFAARNNFYQACIDATGLRAIGFSEEPYFPIDRKDFSRMQVRIQSDEDEDAWRVGVEKLHVTSPNWNRSDRSRKWKGIDTHRRFRYFSIDDDYFWSLVNNAEIESSIKDSMEAQWLYQGHAENPRNISVIRVLKFNDKRISEPLDEKELLIICNKIVPNRSRQVGLFD